MLAPLLSPLPSINIEFCVEQTPVKEPSSPFDKASFTLDQPTDAYRSFHLLPPPTHSPKERAVVSTNRGFQGKGLDAARFEALRNAAAKSTSSPLKLDLRKEVAVRVHQSKQIQRRNLFLSKIEALPSPTAASLPVTPPESPAVFHFTLPSPGLISPLALFETLDSDDNARPIRVEQVDFRAKARKEAEALASLTGYVKQSLQVHGLAAAAEKRREAAKRSTSVRSPSPPQSLPSLDQISKRLGGNITVARVASPGAPAATNVSRLPAFLQRTNPVAAPVQSSTPEVPVAMVSPTPRYYFTPTNEHGPIARPASSPEQANKTETAKPKTRPPPPYAVTLAGPHIASTRPSTPLTAAALDALAYRAERGSVMMERLQRRFSAPARVSGPRNPIRALSRPVGGF